MGSWTGSTHDLAAGVVVVRDDRLLAVYEHGRWGLPKGGCEPGEFFAETAVREAREETGLDVELADLAFVTEFRTPDGEQYLQRFYEAAVDDADAADVELTSNDPDGEIEDVAFRSIDDLRSDLYRFRREPLDAWLDRRETVMQRFDLTGETLE